MGAPGARHGARRLRSSGRRACAPGCPIARRDREHTKPRSREGLRYDSRQADCVRFVRANWYWIVNSVVTAIRVPSGPGAGPPPSQGAMPAILRGRTVAASFGQVVPIGSNAQAVTAATVWDGTVCAPERTKLLHAARARPARDDRRRVRAAAGRVEGRQPAAAAAVVRRPNGNCSSRALTTGRRSVLSCGSCAAGSRPACRRLRRTSTRARRPEIGAPGSEFSDSAPGLRRYLHQQLLPSRSASIPPATFGSSISAWKTVISLCELKTVLGFT